MEVKSMKENTKETAEKEMNRALNARESDAIFEALTEIFKGINSTNVINYPVKVTHLKTNEGKINLEIEMPEKYFSECALLAGRFLMENNLEMVKYFLEKNKGSIAVIRDRGNKLSSGIQLFRACEPSEEVINLYLEKGIYDPETLLKAARKFRNGDLLKKIAKMQKLTVDEIIDRILTI